MFLLPLGKEFVESTAAPTHVAILEERLSILMHDVSLRNKEHNIA